VCSHGRHAAPALYARKGGAPRGAERGSRYQALTGYDPKQGFADFIAALRSIDQGGTLTLPPSGNPFPIKT